MATPIIDLILDDVVTALEGITTANGYETDVEEVYEPTTPEGLDYRPQNFGIQLTPAGQPERVTDNDAFGGDAKGPLICWDYPIQLDLCYSPSDDATTSMRKIMNKFWSDVQKALQVDPQWSDRALDTHDSDPETWSPEDDTMVVTSLIVTIRYRHYEKNPYEQP